MTSTRTSQPAASCDAATAPPRPTATLGEHLSRQLLALCDAMGVGAPDGGATGPRVGPLFHLLGGAARRPLAAGPASPSFVSDDHSPAELSVSFPSDGSPTVRIVAEPGCATTSFEESGRVGQSALADLAARWNFSTEPVDRVADLFLPAAAQGPFALWCALDLRGDRAPGVKVYLNPRCQGSGLSPRLTEEALTRFGFGRAWPALLEHAAPRGPGGDEFSFFAVDLGRWRTPRVKVYVTHHGFSAAGAESVARLLPGEHAASVGEFCRTAGDTERFDRRPLVSCLSFTPGDDEHPTGYTLHVPVRDYAPDDRVARDRAAVLLRRHGIPTDGLDRALAAVTPRDPAHGVGLISYLSLVRSTRQPPRVTVYLSPEAYEVRPPLPGLPERP
ncbi:tryptophan dimethylallyltransferase family protein [Streptomyces sp. NPDC000983]|uniref:tryptophan dimethylallyltransferase family protein n=1 Tax=Streptomyces sp. NPDC000983 TaxID=3154373 RepID=UPI003324E32C